MKNKQVKQNREKEKEFWNNMSNKEKTWILNTSKKEIIERVYSKEHWWEKLIGKPKGKNILDIGCGNTYFVTYWQLTGNDAYGSDFSPETIKNNKLLHKRLELKQNFYVTSSEKIKAKDNFFDIVHMKWVIHHIPPELQDSSMQEIKRVLKKNGRLIIYETNYLYPFRWLVQVPFLSRFNLLRRYAIKKGWLDPEERALTNEGYINLLVRNDFKIEKVDYESRFFWYMAVLFFEHNRRLHNKLEKIDKFLFKYIIPNKFSKDIKIIARK